MSALSDNVFDNGLNYIDVNTENLYILSADPGLTWANIASYNLGVKTSPAINAPTDRSGGGREIVIPAISGGSVTGTGTASHYALTDDSATEILASGALNATQVVTSGNTFSLTEFAIGIPDPV